MKLKFLKFYSLEILSVFEVEEKMGFRAILCARNFRKQNGGDKFILIFANTEVSYLCATSLDRRPTAKRLSTAIQANVPRQIYI